MHPIPLHDPVDGVLHVLHRSEPDTDAGRTVCHLTYRLEAAGLPALAGSCDVVVWTARWPEVGDRLPVTVDRADPARLEVHGDRVEAGPHRRRMAR
jgi:hypothetical protein